MIRQVLTYCILFSFILLYSPRTMWHSHDDIPQSSENQEDSHKTPPHQHDDCYLCTFTLQPGLAPTTIQVVFPHPTNFISTLVEFPSHSVEGKVYFSLRAPPFDTDLC